MIMKVNFNKKFVDCFGNPITEKRNGKDVAIEIWERLAFSLFNLSTLAGTPISQEEKYIAYRLSNSIAKCPSEVELTTEEATFLKRVCAEQLSSGAYGIVADIIESK